MPERRLLLGFALKIMLPALVATAGIAVVTLSLLNSIFNEVNSLDRGYTERAARAALSATLERMEGAVTDNALWDDAVANSYGKLPEKWVFDNWGVGTEMGYLYNMAFIVDDQGKTLVGYERGKRVESPAGEFFGAGLGELLKQLPDDGKTFGKASGIFNTRSGPAAAAAAVILPTSDEVKIPQQKPNRLILAKAMDSEMLATLAKQYTFDDLRLVPPDAAVPDGLPIMNAKGELAGTLVWTSRRPGDIARIKFGDSVKVTIGTLLLVMGALIYTTWKNYRGTFESEERALHNAMHDELSGLPNRRMLLQRLSETLSKPPSERKKLALVYIDLDGFKDVNDSYGHEAGDQLIRAVAAGFRELAGKNLVARLGGDEFAVMVQGPDSAVTAQKLANAMTAICSQPFNFGTCSVSIGASIGVVASSEDIADADELLRRADRAMYIAKMEQQNKVCVYDLAMDQKREERRAIAGLLRDALKAESLRVVYQPIIDARTRVVSGVEALLRWPINGESDVPPEVFVQIAEEFGLIDSVGRFVLMRACRDAVQWPQLKLSVNVSPAQLKNPEFAYEVSQILGMTGLAPQSLELEVTESSIIEHPRRTGHIFSKLHHLGVAIALDDFGAGFSGIGHLRQFKFDRLKIDKSLVKDIETSAQALRMMQAAAAMADSLSLAVTAEGVEHEDQVALLRLAGCSHFQGNLFSAPLEASAITASLGHKDHRQVA